jgi:hypothetical protein
MVPLRVYNWHMQAVRQAIPNPGTVASKYYQHMKMDGKQFQQVQCHLSAVKLHRLNWTKPV